MRRFACDHSVGHIHKLVHIYYKVAFRGRCNVNYAGSIKNNAEKSVF